MVDFGKNHSSEKMAQLHRMEAMVSKGQLSRRDFVQGFTALGLGSALVGLEGFNKAFAASMTPKRGGRLRAAMAQHGPNDTLDPTKFSAGIDYCRGHQIYNRLVEVDDKLSPQPSLATSWEANSDASAWVFKLRKDVEFHDGRKFTSRDVVYNIKRHLDKDVGSTGKTNVEEVSEITRDGDYAVRFTLKGPNADFPINLGNAQLSITPEGHDDFFNNPVGTGPFTVKEFKPGVRSVTVRNDNYFVDGRPYVDEVEWFGITDSVARINALLAGDIHLMAELNPKSLVDIENADGVHVLSTKAGQYLDTVMMRNVSPFDDVNAVLGIKYLFDRKSC